MDFNSDRPSTRRVTTVAPPQVARPEPAAGAEPVREVVHVPHLAPSTDRKLFNILNVVLTVGIVGVLLATVLFVTHPGSKTASESQFVLSNKYQAVFLGNGQLYFGNITNLTSDYIVLNNAYYLTPDSSNSNNFSLVPVGCQQLQDPYNKIVINRGQVTFWENLQDSGRVVTNIKQFEKQNPNGPDCSKTSTQTQPGATDSYGTTGDTSGVSNDTTGGAPTDDSK